MNRHMMFFVGTALLALAGAGATGVVLQGHAFATAAPNAGKAAAEARLARKALEKRKGAPAVLHAEAAVANDPQNPEYRAMLGEAYLRAGRFTSAAQALADALTLSPANGRVALNLALAKIANGDWAGACETLQANAGRISASDRGLALALAGDPAAGVQILAPAAQDPAATVKTRQNLALALAGRWGEAKAVASTDLPPDQVNARLMQWMAFARPAAAYDQVASLLGVQPVHDNGQPAALALANQGNVGIAAAAPVPAPVMQPAESDLPESKVDLAQTSPQAAALAEVPAAQIAAATATAASNRDAVRPHATPSVRRPAPKPVQLAAGSFYVQLGAFENAAVARDSWHRLSQRVPALRGHAPHGVRIVTKAGSFYRLSVGGFARNGAALLCRQVRGHGGTCFVRQQAGDQVARWFKASGPQVAAR